MKIVIQREIFAILPIGAVKSLDSMQTSSSQEEAYRIKNEEEDMSDEKFAVLPATISISLETMGGVPYVMEKKEPKKVEKIPLKFFEDKKFKNEKFVIPDLGEENLVNNF